MTQLGAGSAFGAYRIEGVLGRGGMGVVYRATQVALDRVVALKVLAPELAGDEEFRARFQRESRLLASIDHPNVMPIFEAGELDGTLFLSMRYVQGVDLRDRLRLEQRLALPRALAIVEQVAAALDAAHSNGLVHRDVKPANILIERRADGEHVFLSDFGLTKHVGDPAGDLTKTGEWLGTVDYVAPEQVLNVPVDARADVYALGCVLYAEPRRRAALRAGGAVRNGLRSRQRPAADADRRRPEPAAGARPGDPARAREGPRRSLPFRRRPGPGGPRCR